MPYLIEIATGNDAFTPSLARSWPAFSASWRSGSRPPPRMSWRMLSG